MADHPSSSPGDLQKYGKDFDLTLKPKETLEERKSRLSREEANANLQWWKEIIVLAIVGVMALVCVVIVFIPGMSVENHKWATTMLTTIGSAGVGYMTGKNSK